MRRRLKTFLLSLPASDALLCLTGITFIYLAVFTNDGVYRDVYCSVSASIFFFVMIRSLEYFKSRLRYRAFRNFFGAEALGDDFRFVYPNFILGSDVENILKDAGIGQQGIYRKPSSRFMKQYRIDIPECVAINDIAAITEFVSLFGKEAKLTPKILSDSDAIDSGYSFLSFGLSSNECTHMYFDCVEKALFQIVDDDKSERFAEYIEVPLPDGEDATSYKSTDRREIGIFLRHRPNPEEPNHFWMICAGVGPMATIGVARYVARCWMKLAGRVGGEDFIAVFSVPPYSVEQARLIGLTTCTQTLLRGMRDAPALRRP